MKANLITGEFTLPSGTILSPGITRSTFLLSVEGMTAEVSVRNEPWCSFRFEDLQDSLGVIVFFKGKDLESIHLSINDPKFGTSWEDWSEAKELERKQANDRWLKSNGLLPGKTYSWGSVWSDYSPKTGHSLIVIDYRNGRK
jgi:hypothetical protein